MYARSTTVVANPMSMDAGIAHIRDEVMPVLMDMDGYIGLSMLVDRASGRCIATSAWQTMEAMHTSEPQVRSVRDRATEILGGRPQVDEWEIAVFHRDHTSRPGSCVRATWIRMAPEKADRAIDVFRMAMLPQLQEYDGFCSASLMIDRTGGYAVSSVTFDSAEAMGRTRDQAGKLRAAGAADAGVEVVDVNEYELALAHLRVPEMV